MTFLNALTWAQWGVLAAIPIGLISLYFLKLRRAPVEISSTQLWKKTLEDIHVNSLWQRIRNNLLLWMQLLILALIALACLRPGWQGTQTIGSKSILILDNSASMQSVESGTSRLQQAKTQALQLVTEMSRDDVAMVVTFSDRVEVKQGFTSDKKKIQEAIERIEQTNRVNDPSELLSVLEGLSLNDDGGESSKPADAPIGDAVAAAVANGANGDPANGDPANISPPKRPKTTAVLLSDGGFGEIIDNGSESLTIQYVLIGNALAQNVAITGFSLQRQESNPDRLEAFARIANYTQGSVTTTVSLDVDHTLLDAEQVQIEPGEETSVLFELQQVETGMLKLNVDFEDDLPLDNVAYAAVRPDQQMSILLVTSGNRALDLALRTERFKKLATILSETPDFLTSSEYLNLTAGEEIDLVIYDRCSPSQLPQASTLFLGAAPPNTLATDSATTAPQQAGGSGVPEEENSLRANWSVSPVEGPLYVVDVDRNHPATRLLEMASVAILSGRSVDPPSGGSVLMLGNKGPLFAIAPRGRFVDSVLGFSLLSEESAGASGPASTTINSDWGTKRSFPVFVYSAAEYLGGGNRNSTAQSVQPGRPVSLSLPVGIEKFRIQEHESGREEVLARAGDGSVVYTHTESLGSYAVQAVGSSNSDEHAAPLDYFCVNLFSDRESNLAVQEFVSVGGESVSGANQQVHGRFEAWRWIILVGLAAVLAEWLIFNRRVFG